MVSKVLIGIVCIPLVIVAIVIVGLVIDVAKGKNPFL